MAGSCFSECLARLTGARGVPNFAASSSTEYEQIELANAWLRQFGLEVVRTIIAHEQSLDGALARLRETAPVILSGRSDDYLHGVIVQSGRIVFDPTGVGLSGPYVSVLDPSLCWWAVHDLRPI